MTIIGLLTLSVTALAPAFQPSAAQIDQFKSLSFDEQKKLAESFGIQVPSNMGGGSATPVASPSTVKPRAVKEQDDAEEVVEDTAALDARSKKQDETDAKTLTLEPFGYDLFAGSPSTFAPATDIPVPANYAVGPGDTIVIQLYGKENATHELIVTREGIIQFPGIGPISINGLNFSELKNRVNSLVSEQMIGVKASVTMGALRSIHVFVLGEAYQPGTYTISSLSTMTHALFASGGIKTIGSLRNIQLKRKGKVVTTLDLYDLLLKGDTSNDQHLLPGDVVFIPPIGTTAAIAGEVQRPAIYELKGDATAETLVTLSGGYKPTAYPKASRIERIDTLGQRTVVDINLKRTHGKSQPLKNGDVITVYSVLDKLENIVMLSGHVHRPGYFTWRKGMRVSDIVDSIADLKTQPDLNIGLIKHQSGAERTLSFSHFSPKQVFSSKRQKRSDPRSNPRLKPRDEVILFSAGDESRLEQLQEAIERLNQQSINAELPATVKILGSVKAPGTYPLPKALNAHQAIALAGGLTPAARQSQAIVVDQTDRAGRTRAVAIALNDAARLAEQMLAPGSQLLILNNENQAARNEILEPVIAEILAHSWHGEAAPMITISGPVRFPGDYPFVTGIDTAGLINLAGGLREEAYLYSAEVTRRHIEIGKAFEVRHHLLDLAQQGETGLGYALQMRDKVVIKQVPEWGEGITVSIGGEVRFPGSYPIIRGETLIDLIERAGGLTKEADPLGAVFLRKSLKEKEEKALEDYREQLSDEVARLEQEPAVASEEVAEAKSSSAKLLEELEQADAMGRLVINLPKILKGERAAVSLNDEDEVTIPRLIQEVSIVGEVHHPTSYLYEKGISGKGYLDLSGGVAKNGDEKRAYLISRAGTVKPLRKWAFFGFKRYNKIQPGDTIVVPVDTEKVSIWGYWAQASQVLFQLATTAAALDTVGAL